MTVLLPDFYRSLRSILHIVRINLNIRRVRFIFDYHAREGKEAEKDKRK